MVQPGYAWRLLLHNLPPLLYHSCLWRQNDAWQHIHDMLQGDAGVAAGRHRWRASFDGVEPPIAGPYIQTPTGEHGGSMDGRPSGELPEEFPTRTVQRIEQSIMAPK